jgi:hypothetical protein
MSLSIPDREGTGEEREFLGKENMEGAKGHTLAQGVSPEPTDQRGVGGLNKLLISSFFEKGPMACTEFSKGSVIPKAASLSPDHLQARIPCLPS